MSVFVNYYLFNFIWNFIVFYLNFWMNTRFILLVRATLSHPNLCLSIKKVYIHYKINTEVLWDHFTKSFEFQDSHLHWYKNRENVDWYETNESKTVKFLWTAVKYANYTKICHNQPIRMTYSGERCNKIWLTDLNTHFPLNKVVVVL